MAKRKAAARLTIPEMFLGSGIALLIGFTAWYIWQASSHASDTYKASNASNQIQADPAQSGLRWQSFTDSSGLYVVQYPSTWIVSESETAIKGPAPDWTKVSKPIDIKAKDAKMFGMGMHVSVLTKSDADATLRSSRNDTDHHRVSKVAAVGMDAAYRDEITFDNPSLDEQYSEDNYYLYKGNKVVSLTFRLNWKHTASETSWDQTKNHVTYTKIAESVKFLR